MKTVIRLILIIGAGFFLVHCTSSESLLKKEAIRWGESKVEESFHKEATESIRQSQILHDGYIEYMKQNMEVTVDQVQYQGDNSAFVTLSATILPLKLRRTILDLCGKMGLDKSRRFNFSEAAVLIKREENISEEREKMFLGVFRFQKKERHWVLDSAQKP